MRAFKLLSIVVCILALSVSCGQSTRNKKNEMKSSAEIQAEIEAKAVEEARQATEQREKLLAERDVELKEELDADEIVGFWSFKQATLSGTIAIYSKKGDYKARIVFHDKSVHNENLAKEGEGLYYVIENGHHNKAGEYYKTVGSNLSVCDNDGDIGWFTQVELYVK